MITLGATKNTSRNTVGGRLTSQRASRLRMEEDARVVPPGHADLVAGLEKLGPSRRRVGQQRLDRKAVGEFDGVGRDVADVDETAHLAGKMVSQFKVVACADAHL